MTKVAIETPAALFRLTICCIVVSPSLASPSRKDAARQHALRGRVGEDTGGRFTGRDLVELYSHFIALSLLGLAFLILGVLKVIFLAR